MVNDINAPSGINSPWQAIPKPYDGDLSEFLWFSYFLYYSGFQSRFQSQLSYTFILPNRSFKHSNWWRHKLLRHKLRL